MEEVLQPTPNQRAWFPSNNTTNTNNSSSRSRLNIRGYYHSLPQEGETNYFSTRETQDNCWGLSETPFTNHNLFSTNLMPALTIGMAFYNEEPHELRRTLVSLVDQTRELEDLAQSRVLIVSDGHKQMHHDTKIYLRTLFCNTLEEEKTFDELFASLDRYVKLGLTIS